MRKRPTSGTTKNVADDNRKAYHQNLNNLVLVIALIIKTSFYSYVVAYSLYGI